MADTWNATEIGGQDFFDGVERVAEIVGGTAGKIVATGKLVGQSLGALHRSDMNELTDTATAAIREGTAVAQTASTFAKQAANYLETHDRKQITRDIVRFVRRHPTESLAVAVTMGFVVDRLLLRRRG
jgi:ElaB/YqjD/DUF883 family membrane-anchored ribosome-binding protein